MVILLQAKLGQLLTFEIRAGLICISSGIFLGSNGKDTGSIYILPMQETSFLKASLFRAHMLDIGNILPQIGKKPSNPS